jgi:putative toxin-antitoxin system antitoxin component (TIGR02293 family)
MKALAKKSHPKKFSGTKIVHTKGGQWTAKKAQNGVVEFCVHGKGGTYAGKSVVRTFAPSDLVQVIQDGLPVKELEDLQVSLDVPMEKLASRLGISKATLHRRKASGKLAAGESDRVVRFARLMGKAIEVMESKENARRWLTSPQVGLGGEVPLNYAGTEVGAREVEDLLGRIEYGVYS